MTREERSGRPERPAPGPPARAARAVLPSALAVAGLLVAIAVRIPWLAYESIDYWSFSHHWYGFIAANGHFSALRYDFANYNPPYLYLLATISYLRPDLPALLGVKAVSMVFDFALAFFVGKCVALRAPRSKSLPVLAGIAALLLPTVVANSSAWAQTDSIYTTFLVAGLYFLLRGKGALAFAAFGAAFGFKAQALFLAPALFWLAKKKAVEPRHFLVAGAAYLVTLLPAWIAGRPLWDLLTVYAAQTQVFGVLSSVFPSLWQIPSDRWYFVWPLGVAFAVLVIAALTRVVERSRTALTPEIVITLTAFSALLLPYLLPKMGSRYFFPAVILSLVLAFWRPRLWYWPAALELAEWSGYASILFRRDLEHTVVLGAGVALLPFVLLAGRQFLRDFGVRRPLREGADRFVAGARARAAAAAPLVALAGCLLAVLAFAGAGGRFSRPVAGEGVAAATLARTANLSAETRFVGFTRRTLEPGRHRPPRSRDSGPRFVGFTGRTLEPVLPTATGAAAFVLDNDHAVGAGLALRLVAVHLGGDDGVLTERFGDGHRAQEVAVRAAMAGFWCLAALLAYLSLVRLLGRRWVALGATLLAFSSFAGGAWDAVSLDGSPALCGFLLAFHGMVGFVREGRFRRLLPQYAAASFLSSSVAALALPFAAAGLFPDRNRTRGGGGRPGDSSRTGGEGRAPGLSGWASRNRYLVFGAFALLCSGAVAGLNRANERALEAGGAVLVRDSNPRREAVGAPADAVSSGTAAGRVSRVVSGTGAGQGAGLEGEPASGSGAGAASGESLRRVAGALVPYAAAGGGGGGNGARMFLPVALTTLAGLVLIPVGAALSRRRRLFLPLALSGLLLEGWEAWRAWSSGTGAPAPGLDASAHLGLSLTLFSLVGLAADRLLENRYGGAGGAPPRASPVRSALAVGLGAVISGGVFLFSGYRAGAAASEPVVSGAAGFEERVAADFREIRRRLRRRPEGAVFVPAALAERLGGADAVGWRLVGRVLAERPAARGLAEFVLAAGGEPGPERRTSGLLTPDNREVFLHHRAAFDGELDRLIAAAGTPRVRGEYDLHLDGGQVLYVREECRPEDREGLFVLHLDPADPRDLPPHRRQFGFENLSFRFPDRALDLGERCVARVPLPGYPVRRFVIARHPGPRYADWLWYHEVRPGDNGSEAPAKVEAEAEAGPDER